MILADLPDIPIKITLPNGDKVDAIAGKTTPMDIAKSLSRSLAKEVVVAKVRSLLLKTRSV